MIERTRVPEVTRPAKIDPLETLPLFFKLHGKKVIIAGESVGALWKAELFAATGAIVEIFAPKKPNKFDELAKSDLNGKLIVHPRGWIEEDFEDTVLAIGDFREEDEITRFRNSAKKHGVVVNIIDQPEFCNFQFGTIINRSPIVIGVSTGGAAPVLGQAIRARIEAILPKKLIEWGKLAQKLRPIVHDRGLKHSALRRFWENFASLVFSSSENPPIEKDETQLFEKLEQIEEMPSQGRVTLVGAGPGDPDLLTMKAVRALQMADVILYDDLVPPQILELGRREATRTLVGKRGHAPSCKQSDINDLMVKLASKGKHVVRLKSGDPGIFGRAMEEIAACRAANIPFSIIPGISAAQGAAASLGVSLTERQIAHRLQWITGHGTNGDLPQDLDWNSIADPNSTIVVYMPKGTIHDFRDKILAAGLSPQTPAIAIFSATCEQEKRICASLNDLPDLISKCEHEGSALVMIGKVFAEIIS